MKQLTAAAEMNRVSCDFGSSSQLVYHSGNGSKGELDDKIFIIITGN